MDEARGLLDPLLKDKTKVQYQFDLLVSSDERWLAPPLPRWGPW